MIRTWWISSERLIWEGNCLSVDNTTIQEERDDPICEEQSGYYSITLEKWQSVKWLGSFVISEFA